MTYKTYKIIVEGELESDMTPKELKEGTMLNIAGWYLHKVKVTVEEKV